jgi:trigger factor
MSVVVSIEDVGPCKKRLKIEVPGPAVEAETARVTRDFTGRAKIPGFRPGKAPVAVVQKRHKEDIEHEVMDRLLPRYWKQAEAEAGIQTLAAPELVDAGHPLPGASLFFTADVETRPTIELGNTTSFELPDPPVEPTDAEVDALLDNVRRDVAPWVPVARAAAQGDRVEVEVAEGDAAPDRFVIEIGNPHYWEELSAAVTGLSAGQKAEFTRQHGEDDHTHEHRYRVEVQEVREQDLPPLDDELAKKVELESLEHLRGLFRRRLEAEKTSRRRSERERALLDQLVQRHPTALPVGVVNREIERVLSEFAQSLAQQGVDLDRAGIDWRDQGERARPLAEKKVHARLLLDAIATERGYTVDENEFERLLGEIARREGTSTGSVRQALDRDGRLGELRAQLLRSKTVRALLGEDPGAAPAADESTEMSEADR